MGRRIGEHRELREHLLVRRVQKRRPFLRLFSVVFFGIVRETKVNDLLFGKERIMLAPANAAEQDI